MSQTSSYTVTGMTCGHCVASVTEEVGMMGGSAAGHSFVLVDPEGSITWRADYGGAPDYTMFLPTEAMLTDLKAARTS